MVVVSRQPSNARTLSEHEIVEAALRVVRKDGLVNLSMRRLSRELGMSPMAPYYYVADKEELLDLVVSAALTGISAPPRDDGPWQVRLRTLVDQVELRLREYPGLGDVLIEQMMRKQLTLISDVMEILLDAGFTDRNVLAGYATIHIYLFGRSKVAVHELPGPEQRLPAAIERVRPHLADLGGAYLYEFGIETLIDGLEQQLVRGRHGQ